MRIDADTQQSSVFQGRSFAHQLRSRKLFVQASMHFARIGAAGRRLIFKTVKFLEHLDGQPDHIVRKLKHRLRVVQQNIRIEHVMFYLRQGGFFLCHEEASKP